MTDAPKCGDLPTRWTVYAFGGQRQDLTSVISRVSALVVVAVHMAESVLLVLLRRSERVQALCPNHARQQRVCQPWPDATRGTVRAQS